MKYSIIIPSIIMALSFSCSKKEENKAPKPEVKNSPVAVMNYAQGEELITPAPQDLKDHKRKALKTNPRARAKPFKLYEGEVHKFPFTSSQPQVMVPGYFSGGKQVEFAVITHNQVIFFDQSGKKLGESQSIPNPKQAVSVRLKGKKVDALVVSYGRGRKRDTVPVSLMLYTLENQKVTSQQMMSVATERADVSDLRTDSQGNILMAYYISKYEVQFSIFEQPFKTEKKIRAMKMISGVIPFEFKGQKAWALGRLYGDTPGSDGDAWVITQKDAVKVPSLRGLRSIFAFDTDGDKKEELFLGDGWDKNYGQVARAQITMVKVSADGKFTSTKVAEFKDDFAVTQMELCDVDGDKKKELVVKGNNTLHVVFPHEKWKAVKIADLTSFEKFHCADLSDNGKESIIITKPWVAAISYGKK